MGFARLRERHHAVDDGPERACADSLENPEEKPLRPHGRTEDCNLSKEDVPQIDLRVEAGRRTARDDPTAPGRGKHALGEDLTADVIEHDVGSALGREPLYVRYEVARDIADRFVGPERKRALGLRVRA